MPSSDGFQGIEFSVTLYVITCYVKVRCRTFHLSSDVATASKNTFERCSSENAEGI